MENKSRLNPINEMFSELEKSIAKFMITPSIVPYYKRKLSYFNLINENPSKIKGKKKKFLEEISNLKNESEDNEHIHLSSNDKALKIQKSEFDTSESEKSGKIIIPKDIGFGEHSGTSFYEILAREIIFQVFNYHQLFYFKFKIPENIFKINEENFAISFLQKTYLLKLSKTYKEDLNTEKKIKVNANEKEGDINTINKIDENFHKIEEKKIKDYKIQEEETKINKIIDKIKDTKCAEGEFDFLLPDISGTELLRIINDKKISPFIFYDNIDLENENYDVIGEIKQQLDTNDERVIIQLVKYIQMILQFKESEKLNKYFGLKANNKKIIMYVCNYSYKNLLIKIIDYGIHFKKFSQIEDKFKNISFNQIINNYSKPKKSENVFFELLINSKIPYIFLYIPNNITSFTINEDKIHTLEMQVLNNQKEMEDLKNKDKERENEMKKLSEDIKAMKKLLSEFNIKSVGSNDKSGKIK